MYKIMTCREKVRVAPSKFGMDINDAIKESLREQVEGKLYPDTGIVLAVTNLKTVTGGDIVPEDGAIFYEAEFECLAFIPELNEIAVGQVVDVTAYGAFIRIGPVDAMAHVSQIMDDKVGYNEKAGMLVGKKTGIKLKKDDLVRGRVASVSLGRGGRSKIALTMRQPGLGVLAEIEKEKKSAKKRPERKG
ncbi:MAG: DNA-directed RNA polymerase [Candidatus Aenigmarchaeota archaeon]|nr:DNA-directed RNA polymerase [Candidatus Aenigmarchaeota archaeon]